MIPYTLLVESNHKVDNYRAIKGKKLVNKMPTMLLVSSGMGKTIQ